jgi:ABC-type multidrug transport system fused ATPase/permease subunit
MYCIGFGLAAIASGLTTFIYQSTYGVIGDSIVFRLRVKTFSKLLRMPVSYFDKK